MNRKPNVLLILTDDQQYDTIRALGNPDIHTPNLDRLTARGTAFTHAHIPGGTSGAVCMPSRAMLHSGRSLFRIQGEGQQIPDCHSTLGEHLKEHGYHTFGIGKWHNGPESYARSFCGGDNIFFGGMWDHWNVPVCSYHPDGIYETTANFTPDFFHHNHPMPMICDKLSVGVHSTDLFTDSALKFIKRPQERPFFLYLSYLAPHDPRTMPEKYRTMYHPDEITLPDSFCANPPSPFGSGELARERDEDLAAYPRTETEIRQHLCDYYAMISHLDDSIGKILEALSESGQLDNTIIIFTGDNGLAVGRHGLMGKQNLYDHSVRVPLIMCGPGIEATVNSRYVCLYDIFPTVCSLLQLPVPDSVDGMSFLPALTGESDWPGRSSLYFAFRGLIRAVKDGRYKLVLYRHGIKYTQLFDLQEDPGETANLYRDTALDDISKRMLLQLVELRRQYESDESNPYTKEFWDSDEIKSIISYI